MEKNLFEHSGNEYVTILWQESIDQPLQIGYFKSNCISLMECNLAKLIEFQRQRELKPFGWM